MEEKELYLLITRYLSKQTSTEENEVLVDWIAADKQNEQTFEEVKRVWLGYKRSAGADSVTALAKLHTRIALKEHRLATAKVQRLRIYTIPAAAALVLLIAGWFAYRLLLPPQQNTYLKETTLSGQKKRIVLPDGTRVVLGPESSFSYPTAFEKGKRIVSVIGEAYFEVTKNPHRPFIVQTQAMSVQVLGTHFNVNATKNQNINTVSLLEGKVKVKLMDKVNEEYFLKPGQELSVNKQSHQVLQRQLDSIAVLSWLNNVLIFKNEKLGDVAPRIEKMYGVKIIFTDQATADTKLYATFNNKTLAEVMRTICESGMLAYHKEENKIYIKLNADKKQIK
ncbi:FecR family protein [Mucilaginibacter lutimaris]|uniref:FecR family protein n=1 Tax=Mucilaginibacter lutimaris TaxID=931629 RepID=A0ABW2ZGV8_9SPHI